MKILWLGALFSSNPIFYQNKLNLAPIARIFDENDIPGSVILSRQGICKKIMNKYGVENLLVNSSVLNYKHLICSNPEFIGVIPEAEDGKRGIALTNTSGLCLVKYKEIT